MRHQHRRVTQLPVSIQSYSHAMRNALTSLVTHGHVTTTPKRARALKAYADHFFSFMCRIQGQAQSESDALREQTRLAKRILFTKEAGHKVIQELVPAYAGTKTSGFTRSYKLGARKGDGAEQVYVELV